MREDYRIKPRMKAIIDKEYCLFSLIPTVIWQPWKYRYPNTYVVDIHWLIFHLCFGFWERKKEK